MMDQNSDGSSQSSKNGGSFQPWMSPFGGMWPAFPFNPMGAAPSFMTPPSLQTPKDRSTNSVPKGGKRKPWEEDEEDDDVEEVEDADFKPKRKYTPRTTRGKGAQKSANRGESAQQQATYAKQTGKSASQQLMLRRVKSLPGQFHMKCEITCEASKECPACRLYIGSVLLKPCGHAAFCFSCIDKFQKKCVSNGRLSLCPVNGCNNFVTGWLRMYNVSV